MYDSGTMRFAIGVKNQEISVASNEAEFVVDSEFLFEGRCFGQQVHLPLITDNKERLVIKEHGGVEIKGKLGVNVQSFRRRC